MKHFIIEITYQGSQERLNEVRPEHRAFLQTGYEQGWLLCSGPQTPPLGGMVVARAPSLQAIQQFFETDPYHVHGVASHRFIEFTPVLHDPLLAPWVAEQGDAG